MTTVIERKFLTGWEKTGNIKQLGVRQRVFGELVQLATAHLERYHSDLYHDAQWLDRNLNGPMEFYYGADDSGTAIYEATEDGLRFVQLCRKNRWKITLTHEDHAWYLSVEELESA